MIELRDVSISAGSFTLDNISLQIATGSYAVLMGQTGHGKTTILETICGLQSVTSGTIHIDSVDVTKWLPGDRRIGYVPQDLGLFSNLTVRQHLQFALQLRKQPKPIIESRTAELAAVLSIEQLLDRGVEKLSGGEAQRVAIGRALSFRPSVLLLDEPLSALDENTRGEMQDLLLKVKQTSNVTTLHVTHNSEEANLLADDRLVLRDGVLEHQSIHE